MFGGKTMKLLSQSLDVAALRQRVIANNLANLNTPGFKRSTVSFEESLRKAVGDQRLKLKTTHPAHIQPSSGIPRPEVKVDASTGRRVDGNNVDLEREMLDLVANQLFYNTLVQQVSGRLDNWRYVINQGRR